MPVVSLRDVSKVYPATTKTGDPVIAIDGVSLDVEAGDVYGIIGYSGAGKSTLVRLVNALERSTGGEILIDGQDIAGLPERRLREVRLGIGMIFQQFNLFNSRTVAGNIAYPLEVAGRPRAERAARVAELLDFVGLADKARAYPDQLSGGQKQRVGIARALATQPSILLADEATSALDPETTHEVLTLLKRVNREFGVTIIVITHEMDVIQTIATKVAVMDQGRVIERGDVFDVFSNPQHAASARFVGTVVKGVPSPGELAVLRERHVGRIVTLSFRDAGVDQQAVFGEFARAGVAFEVIYGGINEIQGRSFGHLTLSLAADHLTEADAVIDDVLDRVRQLTTVTEVR
ncbi:D-methionine transport system ATP-binding protein [Cryobacterium psychrotolerans]|uniref:D-methionine transport system ATP-binding protein n=1 Tax=Cryobacterium psychrotolerans TaxID=386301 RepID=A0A1G8XJ83_9MICO|nr:methionine ABC transporter ATP-binding protein [Cryobacterium psychrotolerans]TFD82913.1 methionine ABC transporter ATP-binding protein [Cryobacterium psychrotolerans]SDJ89820.1 D-methionine transport system ATP-binding protein [Cryobacterium psychrotolerans]